MTTVIRARMPLETLKMSQQPPGTRRSKRSAAAYEEEDGDFVFTRSKRSRPTQAPIESAPAPPAPATAKKARRTKERDEDGGTAKKPGVKKESAATPKAGTDSVQVPKRRKSSRLSGQKLENDEASSHAPESSSTTLGGHDVAGQGRPDESQQSVLETNVQPTMISLPFSDTPIINRNKELRKKGGGSRRSSLSGRGRRASSLIESGHSAIPHREVETHNFYKHIEADGLSEPRRMKQLLTWVGERSLGDKPSHGKDSAVELAARVITEQLLRDFGNKSEFSDWFSREDVAPPIKIIKQPNPKNVEAEKKVVELEVRLKMLKEERDQWKKFSKPSPQLLPILPPGTTTISPSDINASLLDPEQAAILASITAQSASATRANAQERLQSLHSGLEFKVDQFADGVHKIEQYQETVGRVADRILRLCANRLEDREKKEKESVGTRDLPMQEVLRSLSRILPESNGR